MSDSQLSRMVIPRKQGNERFKGLPTRLKCDLLDFWQWSGSDLIGNTARGVVAEYLVAIALGIDVRHSVRDGWAAYDLLSPSGIKVEVKSSAYLQSWNQRKTSVIQFSIKKSRAWDPDTNTQSTELKRQAHVYVFALLFHQAKATLNPMDASQWKFFVLSTRTLDARTRSQDSITLSTLQKVAGDGLSLSEVGEAVKASYAGSAP